MKCALELQVVAAERAEEIRLANAEAERKKAWVIQTKTIAECERIGQVLENLADKGRYPSYQFHINRYGDVLRETRNDYADRRVSYNPTFTEIDINTMRQWFAKYCFDVKVKDYFFYQYGSGQCKGFTIWIKPSEDCLK